MKKIKLLFGILAVFCLLPVYADETVQNSTDNAGYEIKAEKFPGGGQIFPLGFFRGTFSLIQAPAEPFRGVAQITAPPCKTAAGWLILPVTLPAGLFAGTCYSVIRILVGVVDIISLGSIDVYNEMCPPFIWDSAWTAKVQKKKIRHTVTE